MELSHLSPSVLTNIIHLVEEKQVLLARLEKTDASMRALIGGQPSAPAPRPALKAKPAKTSKPAKTANPPAGKAPIPKSLAPESPVEKPLAPLRSKRGALKEGILAELEGAGPGGIAASEIAARLGVEPANVHVWFSTTGKKLSAITRISAGRYAIASAAPAAVAAATIAEIAAPEPAISPEPEASLPPPEPPSEIVADKSIEAEAPVETIAEVPAEAEPAPVLVTEEPEASFAEVTAPVEPGALEEATTIVPVAEDAPEPKDEDFQLLASD